MQNSRWFDGLVKDVQYGLRQLVRNPVFTAVAVLSLGLGIGANTAVFSIINAALLKMLPVRAPQELVGLTDPNVSGVSDGMDRGERILLSFAEYRHLRNRAQTVSGMCASEAQFSRYPLRIGGGPQEEAQGHLVSENYFAVFGIQPALGRFFNSDLPMGPGQDPEAVISYDYWQRRFGGKTDVLGAPIRLYGATFTIIGVAAPGFRGETVSQSPDFWLPIMMQPVVKPGRDWLHEDLSKTQEKIMWLHVFARLKSGVTLAKAQAEMDLLFRQILEDGYPATMSPEARRIALDQRVKVREARTGLFPGRQDFSQQLLMLLAASGLVLLISCANVANLLLARAAARNREVGIRLSIGASKARLVRQFLIESLLLALLGGATGVFVSFGASRFLLYLLSDSRNPLQLSAGIDLRVLGFTVAATLLTGLLFGLVPAIRAARVDLNESLKETGRGITHSGPRLGFARMLVVLQVALSLLLVIGAGLLLRTLWNLQSVSLGYPKENLLQARVDGASAGFKVAALGNFYQGVTERLRALPGVRGVTLSENGLFTGTESDGEIQVEGYHPKDERDRPALFDQIGANYFSTLGIPLVLGRETGLKDTSASPKVCVINEAFAKQYFEGRNPVGMHITQIFGDRRNVLEIVGVARNARDHQLPDDVPPRFFIPLGQTMYGAPESAYFAVRTTGDPQPMLEAVRRAILEVHSDVPVHARILAENLEAITLHPRMIARLCSIFGIIALVLAAMGLYGVLSYGVARRTNEIGIRMALGAGRVQVVGMILQETGMMIAMGMVVGILAAVATTRLIASRLYGLSALDPLTIATAACILGAVALAAGYIPAARASRVNPVNALRRD